MQPDVFRPKPSSGWVWWLALTALVLVPSLIILVEPEARGEVPGVVVVFIAAMVGMGVWFAVIATFFGQMRYELADDALYLRYGPLLTYCIPYERIADVGVTDLRWSVWSSMRVPGLALWKVPYAGVGNVRMCSTRATRGVTIVRTDDGTLYGCSPAEEERFADALRARMGRAHAVR